MKWAMKRKRVLTIGWAVLLATAMLSVSGCNEKKKDLSPPPLNPHPKEAVHIRVSFDNPEDAKRYTVSMKAHYQNQQRECGYIGSRWAGNFVYPEGEFDIPNESSEPKHADFTIYLDRYSQETCNWEFTGPNLKIHNHSTGWRAFSRFGGRKNMIPGVEYKETCTFIGPEPNLCWREDELTPERRKHSLVPITVRVSKDSTPLRPHQPGAFSNFLLPMNAADGDTGAHDATP